MPSYIELDKNNNLPSSSGNGKIIFGIDNNGTVIVSDHNGNQFSTVGQSVLISGVTANTITTNTISATTLYGDGSNLIIDPIYCARLTSRDYDDGNNYSSDNLVIGITYTITDYIANDDFSNVADVLSGTINTNGCVFRATGITPTIWSSGTTLTTTNNPKNIIAKNQLGFTPNWMAPSTGTYYFNFKDSVDYSKIFTKFTPTPDLTLNWGSYFTFNYNQFYYQDTSFNNGGFNRAVNTIVNLPNNQILVGGKFSDYNGSYCPYIIKLNEDGTINGDFFNNIGDGFNEPVLCIDIQEDNKILVGGYFNWYNGTSFSSHITRLNSDGTLDNSFNTNVGSICNSTVYSIVVQPDGKILVGGGDFTNNFVRLNSNGTLDTTFNIGHGFNNTVRDIKLQSDGKILVCGYFDSYNLSYCGYGIARLNSNGEIDVSFKVNVGDGFNNPVLCIDIQEDNKILVGGHGFNYFNNIKTSYSIARLNSDGTFDKSFNNGTIKNYNTGFNGVVNSIVAQSGGNILVGGDFTWYNNSDNNSSNTNFYVRLDKYGYVLQNAQVFNSAIYTITPLPYQKVLVGGDFTYYYDNNNDSSANYIQKMYTGFDVVLFTQQYLDSGLSVYCLNNTEIEIKLCN